MHANQGLYRRCLDESYQRSLSQTGAGPWRCSAAVGRVREAPRRRAVAPKPGRVLVAGGRANDVLLDSTEIFDPLSNSFSYGPKMNHERVGHTATALSDGSLLVAGGDEAASAERFNPESKKFE